MPHIRPLLVAGNSKLSPGVWHFDLPAGPTCPGKSGLCHARCYARKNQFRYPQVQERLTWNFEQSKRKDFADRLCDELYRKGATLCRLHVAGDVYSPAYGRKLLEAIGRSPFCRFWLYSRSWRVRSIEPVLRAIAVVPNAVVHYSADSDTGVPPHLPPGVRLAWLQAEEGDQPAGGFDLLFRDHPLRGRLPLHLAAVTCPQETPSGKARGVTCATCTTCYKK